MNDTLRGQLSEGALAHLMQYLTLNQATGCLIVRHPQGEQGYLFFEQGRPVHIRLGSLQDVAAMTALLSWDEGQFTFRSDLKAPERSVTMTADTLLLEAAYQADTARRTSSGMFGPSAVLTPKIVTESEQKVAMTLRALQLLRHLDGETPLAEVAAKAGLTLTDALQAADELFRQGLISPVGARAVPERFMRELTRLMVDLMGPMGEIVVEDALYDLGVGAGTLPVTRVGELLRELRAQLKRTDWQQTFAREARELAQRYGVL